VERTDSTLQFVIVDFIFEFTFTLSCNFIYIIIEDNGVGFKTTPKDLIVPLTTTKQRGSGLGLSIVSKILHEHGGDLNFIEKSNGAKIKLSIKIN
jgi:two-component system nitrogen regulation sensor histidine kinase NtrY